MNPFVYQRPDSPENAVSEISSHPGAKYLGGGTNLVDLMKMGVETPPELVDINRLPFNKINELPGKGGVRIGAMVRNSDMAEHILIRERYPVLSEAILAGASPQLRNRATTGGNLLQRTRCPYFYDPEFSSCNKRKPGSGCGALNGFNRMHAILGQGQEQCIAVHPSDMCVALAALDALVQVRGPGGERTIAFENFHRLPGDRPEKETELSADELILAVDLPASSASVHSGYLKVRDRTSYAFALVSVAVVVHAARDGSIQSAALALGGVAHKPWRCREAEKLLVGKKGSPQLYRQVAEASLKDAKGYRFNSFKIELAKRSITKALSDAMNKV